MLSVLLAAAGMVPLAIHHTSWPNHLLNSSLQEHNLTAHVSRSTGGWLTPFEFHDVNISDPSGHVRCRIRRLQTGRSIVDHLLQDDSHQHITLVHPVLEMSLDDHGQLPLHSSTDSATAPDRIEFRIEDGTCVLHVPWRELPVVELDGLNIQASVTRESDGRWLSVNAVDVLNHARLTARHTEQNLALVAPLLSQATEMHGAVSAQLDPVRIRLDESAADQTLLRGTVQIHSMDAQLQQQWSSSLIQLIGHLNHTAFPDRLQLLSSSTVQFEVTAEGISHHGLTLMLPDVGTGMTVNSSGTLRLDERLDLALRLQVPMTGRTSNRLLNSLASLARVPVRLQVTGTVSEPRIVSPGGRLPGDEFSQSIPPAADTETPAPVTRSIDSLIRAGSATGDAQRRQTPRRIFQLIRSADPATETE